MKKFFKDYIYNKGDKLTKIALVAVLSVGLFIVIIAIMFGLEKEGFMNIPPNNVKCQFLKETREKVQQEMKKMTTGGEDATDNESRDGQINTGLNYYNMQGRDIYLKLGKISGHECF